VIRRIRTASDKSWLHTVSDGIVREATMHETMCLVSWNFYNSMVIKSSSVRVTLALELKIAQVMPQIRIGIDDHVFDAVPCTGSVVLERDLVPGPHRVWIEIGDQDLFAQDPDMALIVRSVRFQHLPDEFTVHSCYAPHYPEHWIQQNLQQGRQLPAQIHSNYLGWPGLWWVDFHTPIYAWLHQKLDLGWLI
jgi:hypothetical protein